MKKLTAILCAILCLMTAVSCAFAEKTIRPILPPIQYDPADLAYSTYNIRPVPMENDTSLKMLLYTPVTFALEDVASLQVGDCVDLHGSYVLIESLRIDGEDYIINEEDPSNAIYLHATEEDHHVFMARTAEDDYIIQYCLGMTEAVFAADFQFKDFRDLEKDEPEIGDLETFKGLWDTANYSEDNLSVFFNEKGEIFLLCLYYSPNS